MGKIHASKASEKNIFSRLMDQARNRSMGNKFIVLLILAIVFGGCKQEEKEPVAEEVPVTVPDVYEFGFNLNKYVVKKDTIRSGDSFGTILERYNIGYPRIYNIVENAKDSFDIRKLQIGKPYTLLCAKDSLQTPECFIYQPNNIDYVVIHFADTIMAYNKSKPVSVVQKEASGIINSTLSETMEDQGLPNDLIYDMSDIYAWTINFFKLQKGDNFKIIYNERYIEDSIYVGIKNIEAAYFQHKGEDFYAFGFSPDTLSKKFEFYDDKGKSLKKAFLKSPIKFSRISSRFNLNRRIAYYGFALRPHKGTDFAASIGTPILATANGTVIESTQKGGNGKYVKIKHSDTYSTQYLHMSRQAVKKGQYVKQGDVIGYVGMTGNSGGPHVCYRFWKNGKQVDPLKEKLPTSETIPEHLKNKYWDHIKPLKVCLDAISFKYQNKAVIKQGEKITKN
ncbi:peptidoglycan DD-metalloendopeptidase family protein [Mariniflexile sp.]|uniref:peptidoglycan DD-metalloendopeptidase family protein n=1 Tax=Mariniflexile sp. TaxID=1979402 RepID=UPI004048C011